MNRNKKLLLSVMIVSLSALIILCFLGFSENKSITCANNNKQNVPNITYQDNKYKGIPLVEKKILKMKRGWITGDCVNIRSKPSVKSEIVGNLYFGENIFYYYVDKNWVKVLQDNDTIGYVNGKFISRNEPEYRVYDVPYTNGKKTFMPYKIYKNCSYKSIFSESSKQYKLQKYCYTGDYGIRKYKDRFCVALGSAFNIEIGRYLDLCLANGEVIKCIMADQKSDEHTDSSNIVTVHNGCMSEFIVDNEKLNLNAKKMGDISYCADLWKSRVVKVKVYKKYAEL